jgi:hypothetical protein
VDPNQRHRFVLAGPKGRNITGLPGGAKYWKYVMPSQVMAIATQHGMEWEANHKRRNPKVLVVEPCGGTGSAGMEVKHMRNVWYQCGPDILDKVRTPDGPKQPDVVGSVHDWSLEKTIERMEVQHLPSGEGFDLVIMLSPVPCRTNSVVSRKIHKRQGSTLGVAREGMAGDKRRKDNRVLKKVVGEYEESYRITWQWIYVVEATPEEEGRYRKELSKQREPGESTGSESGDESGSEGTEWGGTEEELSEEEGRRSVDSGEDGGQTGSGGADGSDEVDDGGGDSDGTGFYEL